MIIGENKMAKLGSKLTEALKEPSIASKTRTPITSGKAIRLAREFQNMTQPQLEKLTGIKQTTISALENDRETLGIERAKVLAKALKVHPSVLAFPNWDMEEAA